MTKLLKGDPFANRYRFTGTMVTRSPLHVGSGLATPEPQAPGSQSTPQPLVARVARDSAGRPLIPGSALRGVMRHWLSHVVGNTNAEWVASRDYEATLATLRQADQITYIKQHFSWWELIFGTPFQEGKIEVWDAVCRTPVLEVARPLLRWNSQSCTYIETSVAIDPETGTAQDGLLYQTEVVAPGVEFEWTITGQNLAAEEVGLILMAIQGFNSAIYPLRLGAHSGRGYGRLEIHLGPIYVLEAADLPAWRAGIIRSIADTQPAEQLNVQAAGYYALPVLSPASQAALIAAAKQQLLKGVGSVGGGEHPRRNNV